jgi:enoyl-CoA hydratase/carnithine racemase
MIQNAAIQIEVHEKVAHLVIDSPSGNEMDAAFFNDFTAIRKTELSQLKVRGMIVYGRGRHFSSGAVISDVINICKEPDAQKVLQEHTRNFTAIELLPFPVVAAISGCCLGSGLELALACHYRVAAERSVFSFPEVSFGLLPGCGGSVRLPKKVKVASAIDILLSGRTFLADEALECGVVDFVVPRSNLIETAIQLIGKFNNA